MPESKPAIAAKPTKPETPQPEMPVPARTDLKPAGESSDPAVHQLLAELSTAEANGAADDAQDIRSYLTELGYSA